MTGVFSLAGFAAHLGAIERDLDEVGPAIVAKACQMLADEIKKNLGEYHFGWQHLKPATIARKALGDTPLFETGQLYNSIEWVAHGNEGSVGTNEPRAIFMEFGTSRGVPPRPFILPAAIQAEKKIHAMAVRAVVAIMGGKGLHATEISELIHLLKHVGHAVKETVDKALEGPEDEKGRRQ